MRNYRIAWANQFALSIKNFGLDHAVDFDFVGEGNTERWDIMDAWHVYDETNNAAAVNAYAVREDYVDEIISIVCQDRRVTIAADVKDGDGNRFILFTRRDSGAAVATLRVLSVREYMARKEYKWIMLGRLQHDD